MGNRTPAEIIHRWFDGVWNAGEIELVDELMAPSGVLHDSSVLEAPRMSRDEFKAYARSMREAFPDIRFDVESVVVDGNRVAARVTLAGTHSGAALGAPPTGRRVRIGGMVEARIADGKIVEGWNSFDLLGFYAQLGLVERPQLAVTPI